MPNINSEASAKTDEHTSNNKNSGLGIAALVLSIPGFTIVVGAILAVIDLFTHDGKKKVCATVAMCICGLWIFTYIVGAILLIKYNDKADNVLQITQESEKLVGIPEEYQSVMEKAILYCDELSMSKDAIYIELTGAYDRFTEEEARYALEHLNVDWNANALAKAKVYCDVAYMSETAIYNQLIGECPYGDQFTEEEVQYAMSHLEVDWNANALAAAQNFSDVMYKSEEWIYYYLIGEYPNGNQYTEEQAQYAMDRVEADWKENALKKAEQYREYQNMSLDEIYEQLTLHYWEYGDGFTEEEAYYATSNLE